MFYKRNTKYKNVQWGMSIALAQIITGVVCLFTEPFGWSFDCVVPLIGKRMKYEIEQRKKERDARCLNV